MFLRALCVRGGMLGGCGRCGVWLGKGRLPLRLRLVLLLLWLRLRGEMRAVEGVEGGGQFVVRGGWVDCRCDSVGGFVELRLSLLAWWMKSRRKAVAG